MTDGKGKVKATSFHVTNCRCVFAGHASTADPRCVALHARQRLAESGCSDRGGHEPRRRAQQEAAWFCVSCGEALFLFSEGEFRDHVAGAAHLPAYELLGQTQGSE